MSKIKIIGIIAAAAVIIIIAVFAVILMTGSSGNDENIINKEMFIPKNSVKWQKTETTGEIRAIFRTEKGDFELKLAECEAAEKFIELAKADVFDEADFPVLAENLFIQTGICGETFSVSENKMACIRGAVGFVNDDGETYPGLVIITAEDISAELEGKVTVFGQIISGMENVDDIAFSENTGYTGGFSAIESIAIKDIEIIYPLNPEN